MYVRDGKRTEMGLGSAGRNAVTLADARGQATECRRLLAQGGDPRSDLRSVAEMAASVPTFGACADDYIAAKASEWRNQKHRDQWKMTLTHYCDAIRGRPVDQIDTDDVLSVLKPIWLEKGETASRLRGRIENVLDAAKAKGHRQGENPARWRGHLDKLLPKRSKLVRGHHAAMPFKDIPDFMTAVRQRSATAALALRFLILTAARSGEVLNARWDEIDLEQGIWTVPATRMKAGLEHRVPLSKPALAVLDVAAVRRDGDESGGYVFPGQKKGRPLSNMSMDMLLRRLKQDAYTVHGFRSSFRDWVGETTEFSSDLAEAALAHVVGNQTERAYRRGDALDRRRKLMDAWATFCCGGTPDA